MKFTERAIQRLLFQDRYRRGLCLPNFTPGAWHECDVFELTEAGYFREYEIKITRSDFKADARKMSNVNWAQKKSGEKAKTKHDRLAAHSVVGPVQFWYVCPKGMLDLAEVPEWAGLIEVEVAEEYPGTHYAPRLHETEVKKAPRLHNEKAPDRYRVQALTSCYYRMHGGGMFGRTTDHQWDYSI